MTPAQAARVAGNEDDLIEKALSTAEPRCKDCKKPKCAPLETSTMQQLDDCITYATCHSDHSEPPQPDDDALRKDLKHI